jgi:hypothetical protein
MIILHNFICKWLLVLSFCPCVVVKFFYTTFSVLEYLIFFDSPTGEFGDDIYKPSKNCDDFREVIRGGDSGDNII